MQHIDFPMEILILTLANLMKNPLLRLCLLTVN